MKNHFVWSEQTNERKNANRLFVLTLVLDTPKQADIEISASGVYTLFLNGQATLHGPARAARGYFRADETKCALDKETIIAILVNDYGVSNYAYIAQDPFLYFKMTVGDKTYSATDFSCFDFSPRTKNVQRYSFQRGFVEKYALSCDYKTIFENAAQMLPPLAIKAVTPLQKLDRRICTPIHAPTLAGETTFCGKFIIDPNKEVWKDRSIFQVGNCFEGFYYDELDECLTDTIGKMVFSKTENLEVLKSGEFAFYDFSRNISGFISCDLHVLENDTEIYLIFDESITNDGFVDPTRLSCASVVKWTLQKGDYSLQTLEPYTLQFAQLIVKKGSVKPNSVSICLFENSECYNVNAQIDDDKLQRIFTAAQNTQAQNSVDLLMDCPSRERSGWINDIYFSMKASEFLCGNFNAVINSLENFALYDDDGELPQNMIPMCYPANHLNGEFIPQCAMWYVINLCEYLLKNPDADLMEKGKRNAYRIVAYFKDFENADGLLENLISWNFIEWSKCNDEDYIRGVNYPTNMLYAKMLADMGAAYNDKSLIEKSSVLKKKIIEQSYNGQFFEDNRLRDESGSLRLQGHITETCQYYAFLTKVATKDAFPALYETLRDRLGPRRAPDAFPNMGKPNIIPGLLARETVLLDYGETEQVLSEVKDVFFVMAERYQTLWEMVGNYASCNHGIAAYAGYLILRALTGFKGYQNGEPTFTDAYAKTDCEFIMQSAFKPVRVSVKNGKRSIEID
ncbi:MAG: hypothetical protein IJB97_07240 [Clostridia bacterium]|nr:hypothetical protein [Clostridia bacterium]